MLLKAFRLFVSSTFADFAAERDVLQRDVFPTLDAYCAAKGYQFYPLDLRWGINEEAQLDQRTAEICLNEVRAAKQDYPPPNFLILIGDRYGFVPLPYAIAQDEFEGILGWLESRGRQDAANALRAVYQYDSNYLAPFGLSDVRPDGDGLAGAYTLRSRVDEVPELRPTDAWAQREAELRAVLQEAADGLLALGRIGTAAHEKYFLSLTDQEIIYGLPGYRPDFADAASSSSPAADGPAAIAFLREITSEPGATPPALSQYFQPSPHLQALKNGIRRALPPDHVVTAEAIADVNGRFSQTYLADFAARIQGKLTQAIDQYIARVEAIQHAADYALTSERDAHRAFAAKKREIFVGREETLAAIRQYLTVPLGRPLVLHGRSGLGKSALLACAFADAGAAVSAPIVARFVGATGASSNVRALLVSVIEDLAAQGVVKKPVEFEPDTNKFNAQIEKLLASITSPAIVFLDALDQLQKPRDLWWLPAKLPEKVKLVISVLDDAAYAAESDLYRSLRERLPPDAFLQLGPLGKSQGRETLLALERQSRRRLQDGQRDYILERFEQASGSPLYLRTAFEIARSWKSYYRAGAGHCLLADDTDGLIAQFIGELSSVQHHEPALVTRTLGYLAAAKNGLSAKELTETLSRDAGVMRAISSEQFGARTDKLPPSLWVRLNRDLSPFLVEKQIDEQPLLQFFHRQVAAVARARHYEAVKTALHVALAAYFESQATAKEGRRIYAKRSLSELPYQLQHADSTARLGEILMSPDWMQQKLNAFGPRPLIDDYQYARTRAQIVTGQALELVAGLLARDPRQLVAQILGRLTARLVDDAAEAAAIDSFLENARALVTAPALVPRWPSFTAPAGAEIRRFEERESQVNAVAFSPDGRRIVSGAGTWYDKDHTVRLWEIASGREIECLRGHSGPVTSVAFSPDQRQIASGSSDRTVRLWEVASGQSRCLQGHTDAVAAVAFSPRGQHIVSASRDKTLRLWETASGNEIRRFEGHTEPVAGAAFSPDGRTVVSGSEDNTLRLWEAASGREIRRFDGHTGRVVAVAFSPDGRNIVSGSWDHTLRVWQVESGQSRLFEGHTAPVKAVVFSADGRSVVSGSTDKTVRIWDVANGQSRCFEGHFSFVLGVAVSPNGRYIVSASNDQTLRLWNAHEQPHPLERHTQRVTNVAFSPSGTQIVSGSYAAPKGEVRLWDVASGRSRNCEGHTQMVEAVAWSPDGWYAASSSLDKTIRLWDTATGREVRRFDHTDGVTAFAFSPDGRHIVSGHWFKGPLRIWDMATGESRLLEGHQQGVPVIVFSADGRHVASGSTDGTVRLWDVASGQSFCFKGHTDKAVDVAFSPDGRHIASASHDGRLGVWDVSSKQGRLFREGYAALYSIAFSPDGRHVVSGSRDSAVRLWDIASGQNRRFEGHTNTVWSVAFSPNGRHIISRSADGTLRLWEVTSGRELFRFEGESGGFDCLAVAADWKSLAAGDWAGQVHLFDILLGETGETISLRGLDDRGPDKPTEPPSTALPAQKAAPTRTEQIASPWYTMKIIQLGGGDTEFICRRCERSIEITPMRGERPPPACPYCLFEGQTAPGADLPRPLQ